MAVQWPAVSAIAGAFAASTAFLTLIRAFGLERERSRDRTAEARSGYFKALLTKPLSREADRVSRIIQAESHRAVAKLQGVDSAGERDEILGDAIGQVQRAFLNLHHELRVATGAWRDDDLTVKLYRATGDWDTQATKSMAALLSKDAEEHLNDIRHGCTTYRTILRRTLFDADPILVRDKERREEKGWLAKYLLGA